MDDRHLINKQFLRDGLNRLAEAMPADLPALLEGLYAPDAHWRGSHPLNEVRVFPGSLNGSGCRCWMRFPIWNGAT